MIKNLKRLLKYFNKSTKYIAIASILVMVATFFMIVAPILLSGIIDNYLIQGKMKGFILILIILLCVYGVSNICNYISGFLMVKVSEEVVYDLRKDLYKHVIKMPISFFDYNKKGDLMSRFTNDLTDINDVLSDVVTEVISGVIIMVGSLIFMFFLSPLLTFLTLFVSVVSFVFTVKIGVKTGKLFMNMQNNLGKLTAFSEEMFSSTSIIKQYNKEKETNKSFGKVSDEYLDSSVNANLYASLMMPISVTVTNLGHMLIVGVGAILILNGQTTIGSILAFITYFDMLKRPVNQLASLFSSLTAASAGITRIFKIMDEEVEDTKGIVTEVNGKIEFKNVSFGYDEKMVIKNLNFKVNKGETVAIVGPTGAGKTTILNLLNKFYLPNSGDILIDGISIKELHTEALRKNVGLVSQIPHLFKGTIKENIYYNNLKDRRKMQSIGVDEMILKFQDGYDFYVEDSGSNISEGQKQLLTIARTAILNPKILLLDEATSNVDSNTERKITDGIQKIIKNKTTFIVAHRLSTIKNADRIIVLDKGEIVEQGSHNELIKKNGLYKKLYNSKFE